jgi:hypothetical protein
MNHLISIRPLTDQQAAMPFKMSAKERLPAK